MKPIDMLKGEIKAIKKNRKESILYDRKDATHLIISFRFKDGTYHHILPDQSVAKAITKDLKKVCRENYRWTTETISRANNMPGQKVVKKVGGIQFSKKSS